MHSIGKIREQKKIIIKHTHTTHIHRSGIRTNFVFHSFSVTHHHHHHDGIFVTGFCELQE